MYRKKVKFKGKDKNIYIFKIDNLEFVTNLICFVVLKKNKVELIDKYKIIIYNIHLILLFTHLQQTII